MKSCQLDGQALKRVRELAGFTQAVLAQKVHVDRTLVVHWEVGRRQPNPANFKRLCTVLKAKPDELLVAAERAA